MILIILLMADGKQELISCSVDKTAIVWQYHIEKVGNAS